MAEITAQEIVERLTKGKPVAAILLHGSDSFLREAARDQIIEASVDPSARDWGIARFDAASGEFADALGRARTVPMLAQRQVVIVSDLDAVEKLGEKKRDALVQDLTEYLGDPAPFTVLVLEAELLDKRMRLAKILGEKAFVVSTQLPQDSEQRSRMVAPMAVRMAREQGAEMGPGEAADLSDLCNGDLALVRSEIAKLATYAGPGQPITRADLELLVISEKKYSVWELAGMLASQDRDRALTFLGTLLREGEQPVALVGAMAWMFRKLMEAQDLGSHISGNQAAGRLSMNAKLAEIAVRSASKIPRAQLVEGLRALYDADSSLKSGAPDQRAVMEFLVARLTAPSPSAGAV